MRTCNRRVQCRCEVRHGTHPCTQPVEEVDPEFVSERRFELGAGVAGYGGYDPVQALNDFNDELGECNYHRQHAAYTPELWDERDDPEIESGTSNRR